MRSRVVRPAVLVLPLLLTACGEKQITSYKVPKEKEPTPAMPADHQHAGVKAGAAAPASNAPAANSAPQQSGGNTMANTPVATASGAALTWKGPSHWEEKPAGGMRKGTFTLKGEGGAAAELAITAFPGDVGGEVANVNRWRGQINLPAQSPEEVARSLQRIDQHGLKISVVEMAGTGANATRVLGAMVPHGGSTWFFKLSGPDALVAKEKTAFMDFLKTIKPANG